MFFQNLLIENKERIRYIIINREGKLNALNKATIAELHTALGEAMSDETTGGLIITGAGQKAFVAGADIAEFVGLDTDGGRELAKNGQDTVFDKIERSPKPVIAAINGYALGGGLELAMACHIRIAADNAKMGLPEVSLGLMPGYGGTQRLTQLAGKGKAMEMIMTGDMITAADALQCRLVNYTVSPNDLLLKAEEILNRIMLRAPLALASAIKAVNAAATDGVDGFEVEMSEFSNCFGTEDFKEGVAAFLEKRKPVFKGK